MGKCYNLYGKMLQLIWAKVTTYMGKCYNLYGQRLQLIWAKVRPGAIPNPESESKDESGFYSGFGIMCSGIGFGVGIV